MEKNSTLLPLVRKFIRYDPVIAANCLEELNESEAVAVFGSLPPLLAAHILKYLQTTFSVYLLRNIPRESFSEIVKKIDPQLGAKYFLSLPQDIREEFLGHLPDTVKKEIQELLIYPENSAGRIMATEFLAFHAELKAKDTIQKIRAMARKEMPVSYLYVVDSENHLLGVINMRDLLLAPADASLGSIMRKEVFTVNDFMEIEQVVNALENKRFFAVPVVNSENHLLGVVRAQQLISEVQQEATEDIQKMVGAGGDERSFSPIGYTLKKRLPWLHVNLVTAFLAAAVVALFEDVIAKITILAVFLPVVAGQGGNAGAQSLAVVMRGLVMREIPKNKMKTLILKESWVGMLNGLVIGIVTALVAWVWHGNPYLGLVIGLAMIVNLFAAGFAGAAIPLIMKSIGLDPAQSSSIILTTITDVVGFFSFLGFAVVFQRFLM